MRDLSIVMYSHSEYSDVWKMFFGQINEHFHGTAIKKYIIADKGMDKVPETWNLIQYDEALPYNKRVAQGLDEIDTEYCIFHHEDMPLYSRPDFVKLDLCKKLLEEDDLDYIKLIKGGESRDIPYKEHDGLFKIPHNSQYIFAVQPTLWKVDSLKLVYEKTMVDSIRDFEPRAQEVCKYFKINGLYTHNGEPKRGEFHWDTDVYPYVATAIVKGKWNLSQYEKELGMLLRKYIIDPEERGVV